MEFNPRKHHRRSIRLYEHEFVVMPNHLHGIVIEDQGAKGRGASIAPTGGSTHVTHFFHACGHTRVCATGTTIIVVVYYRFQGIFHQPRHTRIKYVRYLAAQLLRTHHLQLG